MQLLRACSVNPGPSGNVQAPDDFSTHIDLRCPKRGVSCVTSARLNRKASPMIKPNKFHVCMLNSNPLNGASIWQSQRNLLIKQKHMMGFSQRVFSSETYDNSPHTKAAETPNPNAIGVGMVDDAVHLVPKHQIVSWTKMSQVVRNRSFKHIGIH